MSPLYRKLEAVKDENSFLAFVEALAAERADADTSPITVDGFQGEWANNTITAFLTAGLRWADDSDFSLRPGPKSNNPWHLAALFLWAGRSYE
ncbi:MAG: DUF7660 family protein [Gammaproteobacteria bacterium]